MARSATDAATAAVERLRAAREQAKQRRAASRAAVEQLRERNREESRQLSERARLNRRGQPQQPWPDDAPGRAPREMRLYDTDDDAPRQPAPAPQPLRPTAPPRPAAAPRRASDDDWSQESWLH